MELFDYLMAKKGHNTHRDLFSYLLGKNAGGSGTYTTFSGTSLNISNTLQAKIKNIALEGNTSQETTTGKNLFDKDNAIILNAYFDSNNNVITRNNVNRTTFIKCKKNKTYTVSALNNAMYNITLGLSSVLPAIGTSVYNNYDYASATSASITTDDNAEYLVLRYKERAGTGISLDAIKDYILIEEGTQATAYEPYTGGIPSPRLSSTY